MLDNWQSARDQITFVKTIQKTQTIVDKRKACGQYCPHVTVVIPTYNRWIEARTTLSCLEKSDYLHFDVIVVEDNCTDGTAEKCNLEFPDVRLLHGDGDLWWSGAMNIGVNRALNSDAHLVLWLNDDTRVEPQTISRLVETYQQVTDRSIVCGRVKSAAAGDDEWVGEPPIWSPEFLEWTPPDLSPSLIPLSHPPGGRGVLIPTQCFREIGMIDQKSFPHYWADHDFHYRAMKAGYRYYLATQAVIWNVPNAERPDAPEKFSLRWAMHFLFSRRSPMNMVTLRRLLKRHLEPAEYRAVYYPMLKRTLTWLASGWAAKKPLLHSSLRMIRNRQD